MKHILLSRKGGDRATAYTMSNKIVSLPEGYLCTWIDHNRQNQWTVVDGNSGQILRSGPLGAPCVDNHCGATLALARDSIHAVSGGHQSPFQHYRMDLSATGEWRHVATIDVQGTYPSVTVDSHGCLHLAFRSPGDRWSLDYCRFENDRWTPAHSLVVADKPGYIYWTNGIAVGPDDALHLVFGNTRVRQDGALFYGASSIVSRDTGESWLDSDGGALTIPTSVLAVPLMVDEGSPDRVQSLPEQQRHNEPGPRNLNYQQILLSNPVVDQAGVLHVVLHNGLTGTADLMRCAAGKWSVRPLTAVATNGHANARIHVQSSLSLGLDGRLYAALMIEQTDECVWGPPGTCIVRVESRGNNDSPMSRTQVTASDPTCAQWLPAFPQQSATLSDRMPPLLYTKGANAGGFGNNKNCVETEVYLCVL